jgi:hypothetical protein
MATVRRAPLTIALRSFRQPRDGTVYIVPEVLESISPVAGNCLRIEDMDGISPIECGLFAFGARYFIWSKSVRASCCGIAVRARRTRSELLPVLRTPRYGVFETGEQR